MDLLQAAAFDCAALLSDEVPCNASHRRSAQAVDRSAAMAPASALSGQRLNQWAIVHDFRHMPALLLAACYEKGFAALMECNSPLPWAHKLCNDLEHPQPARTSHSTMHAGRSGHWQQQASGVHPRGCVPRRAQAPRSSCGDAQQHLRRCAWRPGHR